MHAKPSRAHGKVSLMSGDMERALIKCGDNRAALRSALVTIATWATDVTDDKLRERMDLIKRWAEESMQIGLEL